MPGLTGKRFLITQIAFWSIRGSEMVTLELAEYLKGCGASVQVYTRSHSGPIAAMARESGLTVITNPGHPFRLNDYDYIWVHHQLLPPALLAQLAAPPAAMPAFIFHHMSSLDSNKMEQPYIDGLEARLASLSLFISQAARDKWLPMINGAHPAALFPNPAPAAFAQYTHPPYPAVPRRILVVSNHPAPAMPALEKLGAAVHVRGVAGDSYRRIVPEDFSAYDAVVTMGKTVQYCLCAGVPVYLYGHFGAPGYLTPDNLTPLARFAFSGRGFGGRKSHEAIAGEIRDDFARALEFQTARRQEFAGQYSIGRVLPPLLEALAPRKIEPFPPEYLAYVAQAGRAG